ncbi:conserved hypothetical protein [Theileria orientalis strain Shintoku]|uniref:Protein BCP1 n=1 Tax=Theileria orientalis strain Shintoku TaxID=869250 RepID=J7MGT2_THEOR|nr:conserved hypothetical protein [Theileria orientalis strain Shintoku]PVC54299.1 hypothetical protein MACL_00003170 [Theileria orientalis]BAM38731.1 conserved hypothetical protein [Theileria orientalis strain Shintoku]|eukprot:XP_009689032.1 conserved hypothetical protein [Theileria orientalis strain Shintoku]
MSDSESDTDPKHKKRKTASSDEEEFGGEVEADFLFYDPSSDDNEGILTLLQGFMKDFNWKLPESIKKDRYSHLSYLVANQPNIGTLIKVEDDHDSYVMAVLSLLNLNQYDGLDTLKQAVVEKAQSECNKNDSKTFKELLSDKKNQVGLLVNERMANLPSQLIGKIQECLKDDIKWSKENVEEEDEGKYYNFTHILGISRLYLDKSKDEDNESTLVYHKPEERFYYDNSLLRFMWPTGESNKVNYYNDNNKKNTSKILPEYMFVYCLSFDKFNHVVKEIAKNFRD